MPSKEWQVHRQAHSNAAKPRRWTKEWVAARNVALKRDRYRCQVCGRNREELRALDVQLHVHHINENSSDNRPENLVSLCSEHHPRGGSQPQS